VDRDNIKKIFEYETGEIDCIQTKSSRVEQINIEDIYPTYPN
jgi:hypothetical protein